MAALTQLSLCFYLSKTGSCNGDIDFWVTLFLFFFWSPGTLGNRSPDCNKNPIYFSRNY